MPRRVPRNDPKYHRAYRAKNRLKLNAYALNRYHRDGDRIDKIKLQRGCIDCGYNKCAEALHFDHVQGTKRFNIAQAITAAKPWPLILDEIAKCDVRCANCHYERTAERRITKPPQTQEQQELPLLKLISK